mgnify:CR=1 FL=1
MDKIRVGAVSYLNTKPLLYGLEHAPVHNEIELLIDYPARVAAMLMDGRIDVGLVPVAVIPKLKEAHVITDYCIGADGPVASVCLFSEVPVDQIKMVYLDYQSRTSVNLAKILLREYWKQPVTFMETTGEDFRSRIGGTTAAVVIGDRALEQRSRSNFIYDLSEAWKKHTGLPFVFAAWVSNKKLPFSFVEKFNEANALGLQNLEAVLKTLQFPAFPLRDYFTKYLSYSLNKTKFEAMQLFLERINKMQ